MKRALVIAVMFLCITVLGSGAIAAKNKRPYVGFELDQPATLEQAVDNHKKSVEYLKGKFGS